MSTKKVVGVVLAVVVLLGFYVAPCPEGLSYEGKMAWAFMLSGIVLWVCESVPLGVSAITLMCLMPYFGVGTFSSVFSSFISSTIFFLIGVFGITVAMSKTTIPQRIVGRLMLLAGRNPRMLILAFMVATAILSMFMSDIATCGLMLTLLLPILHANKAEKLKSNLAKCLMIGVPYACVIGGAATPCGCATNVMAINMMSEHFGITISFMDWVVMGLPLCIIILPISWFALVSVFKPEAMTDEAYSMMTEEAVNKASMTAKEKKLAIIVLVEIALWIASSWIPVINTNAVAVFALALMFMPGIEVMTWKDYAHGTPWDVILLIGGVQAIAAAIVSTGAATWLLDTVLMGFAQGINEGPLIGLAAFLAEVIHLICPVGPANVGLNLIPMTDMALAVGISPAIILFLVGCMSAGTYIVPYDCVPILTYSEGYYSVKDMCKVGWVPMVLLVLYMALIMPNLAHFLGY